MRHRVDTFKIGRTGAHRRAMMANMISSLIEHGRIETTLVKAKEARRWADKLVTMGKKGDLHRRRLAIAKLRDKDAVRKLFAEVAPNYADREGGYTRIIKLGKRKGDAAEMCILEFVEAEFTPKPKKEKAKKAEAPKKSEAKVEETEVKTDAPVAAEVAPVADAEPTVEEAAEIADENHIEKAPGLREEDSEDSK